MAAPKPSPETTLRIQRLFTAPREVVLTHEFFPNKEACDNHTKGWHGCFETLAKFLEA